MLVLHPKMTIRSAGAFTSLVGVKVWTGICVSVMGGIFVLVGKKVGVIVDVAVAAIGVDVMPTFAGVGL